MGLKLNATNGGGSVELDVPDTVNSDLALTVPATAGEIVVKGTDDSVDLGDVNIDSSGRLLVGTSTARSNFFNDPTTTIPLQIEGTGTPSAGISLISNPGAVAGNTAAVVLGKTRGSSVGSTTIVASGDELGVFSFQGSDGSEFIEGARITGTVDGTPGTDDMPGRLSFSTTLDGASSPTERVRIRNNGGSLHFSDTSFVFRTARTGAGDALISFQNGSTTIDNGTQKCRILADGDLENANNTYGALSDVKLKENIVDAESQWEDLKGITIRNYNFKEELGFGTNTHIGVVAQELELVSPNLVKTIPDRDDDDNDLGTTTKSVKYSVLYMKAVKALQEAMTRIETLEAKVAALEESQS